jgi:DNA-binding response OmpR family regulator
MEGYTVLSSSDGEEALNCIKTESPDLILLDVRMPKMSGLQVLEHLKEDTAATPIPVIMLSVVTTYPEVRTALQLGAVAYLPKPFELREMSRLIARLLSMNEAQRELYREQALQRRNGPVCSLSKTRRGCLRSWS